MFRKFPRLEGGEIIALFPDSPGTSEYDMSSYMRVGQHGTASLDLVYATKPANPSEYADLKKELERAGYRLKVVQKTPSDSMDRRRAEMRGVKIQENPFDLESLEDLIGIKPITAKIVKVGKQIQLHIEKPTKELLYRLGLRKSKNPLIRAKRGLSVPDKHLLRIAQQTLRMPDAMVGVMGGPDKAESRRIIQRLTGRRPKENPGRRRGRR
jgi:hypothetical protein